MKFRHAIILALLIAGSLVFLTVERTRPGAQATAAEPASAVGVRAPVTDSRSLTAVADEPHKRADAAFRQDSVSKYAPQPGDDRETKQIKRVEAALIQRFLETAPVPEHELGRLMELLLKRGAAIPASEKATVDAEIRTMVGDEYFSEIEKSSQRVNVRLYAIEFIGEALWRGEPLTAGQREALNRAIEQVDKSRNADPSKPAKPGSVLREYDLQVLDAARSILSPQQIGILKEVRTEVRLAGEQ